DCLRAEVQAARRLPGGARLGKLGEDVQYLERGGPARRTRREGELEAAICSPERREHARSVAGEIGRGEIAAVAPHLLVDGLGNSTLVEDGGSVLGEEAQAPAEFGLAKEIAARHGGCAVDVVPTAQVGPGRLGKRRQLLAHHGGVESHVPARPQSPPPPPPAPLAPPPPPPP